MSQVVTRRENGRKRVQTVNEEESRTVQGQRDEADIRKIIQRYQRDGVLINMAQVDLAFRDVTEFEDFSDLMRQTKEAEQAFMRLPSKVREVFNHSVVRWLDAAHDGLSEVQRGRLTELGVLDAVEDASRPVEEPAAPPAE